MLESSSGFNPKTMMIIKSRLLFIELIACLVLPTSGASNDTCRHRDGEVTVDVFQLVTCANCYGYLFPIGKQLRAFSGYLILMNGSSLANLPPLIPDVNNATSRKQVCETLNDDECSRWVRCCQAAEQCCAEQMVQEPAAEGELVCPRTWDGYACWKDTHPKTMATVACPTFLQHAVPSVRAMKTCSENGTWYKDPDSGLEWTNYTKCLDNRTIKMGIFISVSCNAISIIFLVPAILIFLFFKSLRSQHRIRVHVNLFASFIFSAIIFLMWDLIVFYDRLVTVGTESRMHANSIGCKLLYVLTRYTRSTNFMWMFCEGFYLYRLIVNAFEPPTSLLPLYIVGWGLPWLPTIVYSSIHATLDDQNCWVNPLGAYEWIIYLPNLLSLAMNLFFLFNILRILMTQITVHPNEPSHYRRALKATSVLIPLFGIQLLFIIYRPPPSSRFASEIEIISYLITNLQGFFVALIFCFLNNEVLSQVRRMFESIRMTHFDRNPKMTGNYHTQLMTLDHTNNVGHDENKKNDRDYIPMKQVIKP